MSSTTRKQFRFEGYTVDTMRGCLRTENREIPLRPKCFELLCYLVENAGRLVSKEELIDAVWRDVIVTDDSLTRCVSDVRHALDDQEQRIIKTVRGRGYLLAAPVSVSLVGKETSILGEAIGIVAGRSGRSPEAPPIPDRQFMGVPPSAHFGGGSYQNHVADGPTEGAICDLATQLWPVVGEGDTKAHRAAAVVDVPTLKTANPPPEAHGSSPSPGPATASPYPIGQWGAGYGRPLRAGLAVLISATVVILAWLGFRADRPSQIPQPARLSIAVLPFVNSSGDPENNELTAALTESATIGLAQVGGAFVIAKSMAQAIAARKLPLSTIRAELGVRYVLEGNVRRLPNAVDLTVQLSDATSNAAIWTARFQSSTSDPDALATRLARRLLFPLRTAFMDAEARRLSNVPIGDLSAADLLLQVKASSNHEPLTPAKNGANIARLNRALELEPSSTEIMTALALQIVLPIFTFGERNRDERLDAARALAERARSFAAGSESLLRLQAFILRAERRFDEAIAANTSLLEAHPASAGYRLQLAFCLIEAGRSAEAVRLLQDAIKMDDGGLPLFSAYAALGHALLRLGRNDEAIDWVRAAKEQSSGASTFLSLWLTAAFAHAGKGEEARRELREFISQRPASTVRGMRHDWPPVSGPAEERQHEIDGLEIAGLRDHVDEDADPGLPITAGPRSANLTAPTPIGAPGVTTIRTSELSALVGNRHSSASNAAPPLVLSTICAGCKDIDFPGAVPVPAAHHRALLDDKARQDLKAWLDRLSGGDQTRHLITMSWNAEQWQSRNLAMELVAVGYPNVTWYRGGLEAWDAAGLPVVKRQ